jgi:E3 ubiquitin-protein ligase synoviolin
MFSLTPSTDFLKLTVYVAFFSVLLGFYGLPLHIMRDLFLSFRSFFKRVADFVRYRNATRDMHARYPDATSDEVGREDVCIICREEMRPVTPTTNANGPPQRTNPVTERMRPKKLPCGHILHFSCLRSWLERQQNCPTCRRPVVVPRRAQGQAANHPALPGNAAGQPGGVAVPGNAPELAGRNRARVINLGPLRIGFGAGGGNLIDDLAQRLHNGEPRPPAEQPANAGGQQQFGFGFGFGRRPNPQTPPQTTSTSSAPMQAQLDQIERSLQQQITSLRMANNELHVVRMLNIELSRLRNLQANASSNEAGISHHGHPAPLPILGQGQLPHIGYQPPPTWLSNHAQQALSSESNALPEGVTLSPGWTLMPLQRYEGANRSIGNSSAATLTQPATTSIPPAAQPAHISPQSHSSTGVTESLPLNSVPMASISNRTAESPAEPPAESPAANGNRPPQIAPSLPSWGTAPAQVNGGGTVEPRMDIAAVTNGQEGSEVIDSVADTSEGAAKKGKGKAATVEDLADDVD